MPTTGRVDPLTELVCQFIDATKAFWQRRAAINELASLSASDIACIGRDLGISAAELRVLASRNKGAADLLIRRMETLRLEPGRVDPSVMRDLQHCCSNCDSKQLCVHELEDKPKDATWPKYCPHEQTIKALMETAVAAPDQPGRARLRHLLASAEGAHHLHHRCGRGYDVGGNVKRSPIPIE